MTALRRRQLLGNLTLGALLTALAGGLHVSGALDRTESWLYDQRCRRCQPAMKPTDKLAHVEIDDESIAAIGRWPWPRSVLASIVTEIHAAGARAIGLDVLLADREQPADLEESSGPANAPDPVELHDAALVGAFRDAGNVVLPVAFVFGPASTSSYQTELIRILIDDLETTREQAGAVLDRENLARPTADQFLTALHEAAASKIRDAGFPQVRAGEVRRKLLPGQAQLIVSTVASRVLDEELARAEALRALGRLGRRPESGIAPPLHCRDEIVPLPEFTAAAQGCGFVDFIVSSDGVTRRVPLWVEDHDKLYPQFGLALACAYLNVKPQSIGIFPDSVVVPRPDGQTSIPVGSLAVGGQPSASLFMDVPFFGSSDWLTSYDYPRHEQPKQHLNVTMVWEAVRTVQRIRHNNRQLDDALARLKSAVSIDEAQRYMSHLPDLDDVAARQREVDALLKERVIRYSITESEKQSPDERQRWDEPTRTFMAAAGAATTIPQENRLLLTQLGEARRGLREALSDKAVLIGSAATAAPDFRTTPLQVQCPGFVVHGMVFNAILTGYVWRRTPHWIDFAAIAGVGLLATIAVVFLPPWAALTAVLSIVAAFLAIDGVVLFERLHWILPAAGPLLAAVVVWAGLTLVRLMRVSKERAHIVRRFRYYVDPALVSHVIEHPDRIRLEGEVRELTVVVARLEGFGAITEQLRERTVDLLNQYMNVMVPLIRARGGYVNKFLGGGVMFFFGAPMSCEDHATRAVDVVLSMQAATAAFNERHTRRGMPTVQVRAGISSGPMVVGDAGADSGSDYTVLGEAVNLCFRFEEANKLLGTRALFGEATLKCLGGRYLVRPVGSIDAAGMPRAVRAFEPLCILEAASERDHRLVRLTTQMVDSYLAGKLDDCAQAVARLEDEFGSSPLSLAYGRLCRGPLARSMASPEVRFLIEGRGSGPALPASGGKGGR